MAGRRLATFILSDEERAELTWLAARRKTVNRRRRVTPALLSESTA